MVLVWCWYGAAVVQMWSYRGDVLLVCWCSFNVVGVCCCICASVILLIRWHTVLTTEYRAAYSLNKTKAGKLTEQFI